jgi:GT2 family glycosyltransferase
VNASVTSVGSKSTGLRSPPDGHAAHPRRVAAAAERPTSTAPRVNRWKCAMLWLRIQADAFAFAPLGYLQALAWRARGLRVRSRNRIAALAGRSPSAYAFWVACREPRLMTAKLQRSGVPPIVIVIDCRRSCQGLRQSLDSLPVDARPVLIGGPEVAGAARVQSVADLASCFDGPEAWLCAISCGDLLAGDALAVYADAIARNPTRQVVYSDDDLVDETGRRNAPHFKPDWNPELFQHHDFLTGASVVRVHRDDLHQLDEERWMEVLVRKTIDRSGEALHVARVLHHRRNRPAPILPAKPAPERGERLPSVTAIIPTRNRSDLLRNCVEGLLRTGYPGLEIIVVDNHSDEPESVAYLRELAKAGIEVMRVEGPFNYSALNNAAAARARGELLCFLNNDVEMLESDWLALLARQAVQPDIGAVGARLLYPDGTVQHAGVFTGIGGGAGHGHRFLRHDEGGYFERARLPQRVSAVTAACLVVSREKFLAVHGFDERDFPVAFNDVDLCLKLNERGWQAFYEPRATLIHHESKSRGSDSAKANRGRFAEELAALKRKWRTHERPDPFHHPHLSPFCEQFLIGV